MSNQRNHSTQQGSGAITGTPPKEASTPAAAMPSGAGATTNETTVVEEATHGVTSGSPSGGTSGGVGAAEVEERTRRAA